VKSGDSNFLQDESSSYKLGASCFLQKPQSFRELQEIIASICRLWLKQNFSPVKEPVKNKPD
jgi:hypothetical protein